MYYKMVRGRCMFSLMIYAKYVFLDVQGIAYEKCKNAIKVSNVRYVHECFLLEMFVEWGANEGA